MSRTSSLDTDFPARPGAQWRWTEAAPLPVPRAGCAAGVVDDRLVVAGGTYWRDGVKIWCDRTDCFDPQSGRWEPAAPLPRPHGDAAAVVHEGNLLVLGGGDAEVAVATAWGWQGGSWHERPDLALPTPRRSGMAAILNGTVYLLGGWAGNGTDYALATSTFWAAAPGGPWRVLPPLPGPPRFAATVAAVAGQIVVAGGCTPEQGGVRNLAEILAYEPAAERWSTVGRLPLASRAAAGVADRDGLLLFGGYTEGFTDQILRFDLRTGTVVAVGVLPHALADARFLRLGAGIIGASGENGIKQRARWTLCAVCIQ